MDEKKVNGETSNVNWLDITEDFKTACDKLDVGELLHCPNFTLFEAMSAFEMMDPKMDSGIIGLPAGESKKALTDLKKSGFTCCEIVSIVDGTLCCIASWLEGGSMAQTIFANIYLHDPFLIEDRILKALSVGMLKLVAVCKDVITSAGVYEDEHFQPSTHGFQLADSITEHRALGMLKETEDELAKSIRGAKAKLLEADDDGKAVLAQEMADQEGVQARLRIIKHLMSTILALKYQGTPVSEESINKGLDKLKEVLDAVGKMIEGRPIINPLQLAMFDISTTSRLLPPSFPRTVQLMTMPETLQLLSTTFTHLKVVNSIPKKMGLVDTMDYFDKFSYEQPSILVRSLLLYHYLPTGSGKVFNKHRLTDLVADELRSFNSPPVLSPSLKQTLMAVDHIKLVLNAFLGSTAHVLDNLFIAKCNTQARQRERVAYLLEELGVLQTEAERVDAVVDDVVKEKLGEKALGHHTSSVGTWVLFLTTKTMIKYLTLGMELELYDVREYCYFFWYLSEVILLWNTSSLFRAEKALLEPSYHDVKGGNKRKGKQKKAHKVNSIHQEELMSARCKQHICGGLYKLLLALKLANLLPTTGDYTFDNEKVRYTHRFAPFSGVNFPQLVPYKSYVDAIAQKDADSPYAIVNFLRQAFRNFETAKNILEGDMCKSKTEEGTLLNLAKNNMVVTKILADNVQKEVVRHVKFDFSNHKIYPMVKFV